MPLLKEKVYTIEDIYALPEGERAELTNLLYVATEYETSEDLEHFVQKNRQLYR